METTFRVEWSITVDAENELNAAKTAWDMLKDSAASNRGATVVFVSDEYGDTRTLYDMETVGQCYDCNKAYITYLTSDHCVDCGSCFDHCVCKFEMAGQL